MLEQFLHEQLEIAFNFGIPKPEMPDSITQNLNPAFELRPYQEDAYTSFIHYFNNDLPNKEKPLHLLFNMATGRRLSWKTVKHRCNGETKAAET
jgi:type III restriction enzyme